MVDVDPTGFIITLIVGIGVPLAILSMNRFKNTAEGTLTGTIKLEGLRNNVTEVKEEMQKNFDKMESILDRRDAEMRQSFNDLHTRIETLSQKVMLNEYRIKSLEKTRVSNIERDRVRYPDDTSVDGGSQTNG
jgi:uncharacterized membrane-anchored protein YhcB (DUF1043 family)